MILCDREKSYEYSVGGEGGDVVQWADSAYVMPVCIPTDLPLMHLGKRKKIKNVFPGHPCGRYG